MFVWVVLKVQAASFDCLLHLLFLLLSSTLLAVDNQIDHQLLQSALQNLYQIVTNDPFVFGLCRCYPHCNTIYMKSTKEIREFKN